MTGQDDRSLWFTIGYVTAFVIAVILSMLEKRSGPVSSAKHLAFVAVVFFYLAGLVTVLVVAVAGRDSRPATPATPATQEDRKIMVIEGFTIERTSGLDELGQECWYERKTGERVRYIDIRNDDGSVSLFLVPKAGGKVEKLLIEAQKRRP